MDIPIYRFLINENEDEVGMVGISLVENPAFQSKFVAFNKDVKPIKFVEDKKYKQVLTGLAIIPDKLIYRYDEELGEYYGYFSAEEIEKIRNKFHKQHFTSNVNTDHNDNNAVNGYLIESYILDTEERVKEAFSRGIEDAVLNAWLVSYKIEDKEVFEKALNGEFTGFSIESFLKVETKFSKQKNNINVKYEKMKSKFQSIKDKILNLFTEIEFEEALVNELGFTIKWTEVGQPVVKLLPQEGSEEVLEEPVGEGEYLTDMGIIVVDENSNLVEIKEVEEEEEVEMATVTGTYKSGEEDVQAEITYTEVDSPVMIGEQNISEVVEITETLEITLEDGTVLVVNADGILIEIKSVEEEDEKEEFATDIDKKLKDLIGNEAGSYYIEVTIDENGNYIWGSVTSYNSLMLSSEHTKEVRKFQREIKKLKEKLSEPVVEPVLTNQKNDDVDLSKMSKYERLMHEKGLQPLFKK